MDFDWDNKIEDTYQEKIFSFVTISILWIWRMMFIIYTRFIWQLIC